MMGDYKGVIIADLSVGHGGRNHAFSEAEANAHLIAAAPDLLEACNEIYNSWHYFQCPICGADDEECKPDCAWPKMVRAILKAEAKE